MPIVVAAFTYPNFCFIPIDIGNVKENSIKVGHRNVNGFWFQPAMRGRRKVVLRGSVVWNNQYRKWAALYAEYNYVLDAILASSLSIAVCVYLGKQLPVDYVLGCYIYFPDGLCIAVILIFDRYHQTPLADKKPQSSIKHRFFKSTVQVGVCTIYWQCDRTES